jgi:hypothetical protein
MKKVLSIIAIAAVSATFVACGPNPADLEAAAKRTADSLAQVAAADSARIADSLSIIAKAAEDSIAREQAKADSIRVADSLAKGKKGGKGGK